MAQCSVLRCDNPPSNVRQTSTEDGRLPLDFLVCAEHHRQLEAGEPFRYNFEDGTVYLGADIDAAGLRLLVKYTGWQDDAGSPPGVRQYRFLDEQGGDVAFYMHDDLIKRLARDWSEWGFFAADDLRPEKSGEREPGAVEPVELDADEEVLARSIADLMRVEPAEPNIDMPPEQIALVASRRHQWEQERQALMAALGRRLAGRALHDFRVRRGDTFEPRW